MRNFFVIFFTLTLLLSQCDSKTSLPKKHTSNSDTFKRPPILKTEYYSKRLLCPNNNRYQYLEKLTATEDTLKNYFKVEYSKKDNKQYLFSEAAYIKIDQPVGIWFYYNEKNKKIREEIYKDNKLSEIYEHVYHDTGEIRSITHYTHVDIKTGKKKLRVKSIYLYNLKDGKRILKKLEHYHGGVLDEYLEYDYDPKGRLSKRSIYHFDDKLVSFNLYSYDTKDRIIRDEIYNRDSKKISYLDYKYDDKGNLIEKAVYHLIKDSNNFRLAERFEYNRNKKGYKILEIEHGLLDGKLTKIYEKKFCYNEGGCILGIAIFDKAGKIIDQKGHCK